MTDNPMAAEREGIDVWIIEDDPTFRTALEALLTGASGIRCTGAFDRCEKALAAISKEDPPGIVLVDIGLPGMSGIEGIRRMKELAPSTEFIVLTVHEEQQNVFDAICAGATGYLIKNLPPDSVLEKIREAASGGAPMDPHIARRVLELLSGGAAGRETYGLTDREKQVLHLMVEGLTRQEIADRLFVSLSTIIAHSRNTYAKLHVHTRGGAVAKALKERLV
jgi:DNA-binding NarL/FixJ family response regulator